MFPRFSSGNSIFLSTKFEVMTQSYALPLKFKTQGCRGKMSYCTTNIDTVTKQNASQAAIDIAMDVNKIKKQHQAANVSNDKKEMEARAWDMLNSLSEPTIMSADGKAVALLLNSWAYFSKHWAGGKDGPRKCSSES